MKGTNEVPDQPKITAEELEKCTRWLETIAGDALILSQLSHEDRVRLMIAAGRVIHPDRNQVRRRIKAMRTSKRKERESKDRVLRASTDIRAARLDSVFVPAPRRIELETADSAARPLLQRPRDCYVCKTEFDQVHFFMTRCAPPARASTMKSDFKRPRSPVRSH